MTISIVSHLSKDPEMLMKRIRATLDSYFRYYPGELNGELRLYKQGRGGRADDPICITTQKREFGPSPIGVPVVVHTIGSHGATGLLTIEGLTDKEVRLLISDGPYDKRLRQEGTQEVGSGEDSSQGEVVKEDTPPDPDVVLIERVLQMRQELPTVEHEDRVAQRRYRELMEVFDQLLLDLEAAEEQMERAREREETLRRELAEATEYLQQKMAALKKLGLE